MAKQPSNWINMGRAVKNDDGTEGETHFPSITVHGEGDPPDLKDGPYAMDMKHAETHVTTGLDGKKTHQIVMHAQRMKPMDQSPNTMQGPKASPSFAGRSVMDGHVAAMLKSKAAPNATTQVS